MHCPICGKTFSCDDPNVALPFCSVRCKSVDMNRWLSEEYSVDTVNIDQLEREIAEVDELDDNGQLPSSEQ